MDASLIRLVSARVADFMRFKTVLSSEFPVHVEYNTVIGFEVIMRLQPYETGTPVLNRMTYSFYYGKNGKNIRTALMFALYYVYKRTKHVVLSVYECFLRTVIST